MVEKQYRLTKKFSENGIFSPICAQKFEKKLKKYIL